MRSASSVWKLIWSASAIRKAGGVTGCAKKGARVLCSNTVLACDYGMVFGFDKGTCAAAATMGQWAMRHLDGDATISALVLVRVRNQPATSSMPSPSFLNWRWSDLSVSVVQTTLGRSGATPDRVAYLVGRRKSMIAGRVGYRWRSETYRIEARMVRDSLARLGGLYGCPYEGSIVR